MHVYRLVLLLVGVVACSSAALMIKMSRTPALLVAAYRLLAAACLLSPLYIRARRRFPEYAPRTLFRQAGTDAVCLAVHFWTGNVGVRMTTIANATLIVNLVAAALVVTGAVSAILGHRPPPAGKRSKHAP